MNKIGIFINPDKDPGYVHLNSMIQTLRNAGFFCSVSCGSYPAKEPFPFEPAETFLKDALCCITLGGDGTLLRAVQYAFLNDLPVLGVNLGHLGFLAEMEVNEIPLLPKILKNQFVCSERMLLDIQWIHDGQTLSAFALNDLVLKSNYKPSFVVLSQNGSELLDYYCDGFIVATPTGSTAYSMSAGGPILEPGTRCIVTTPICPHTMKSRAVVFDADHGITLSVTNADHVAAYIMSDGITLGYLSPEDRISVKRHQRPLRLVRIHEKNFYHVLNDKMSQRVFGSNSKEG